jgi:N-acyl-D-aspartate/D-glutamate deacylase
MWEEAMHDTLIKGGRVVDGTGAAPYNADIAIRDGKIVEIGSIAAPAKRTIQADGALVTPGFVDVHTHYDGQATWDQRLQPSSCTVSPRRLPAIAAWVLRRAGLKIRTG